MSRNLVFLGELGSAGVRSYAAHCHIDTNIHEVVFFKLKGVQGLSELLGRKDREILKLRMDGLTEQEKGFSAVTLNKSLTARYLQA